MNPEQHLGEIGLAFKIGPLRLVQGAGLQRVALEIPDGRESAVRRAVLRADGTATNVIIHPDRPAWLPNGPRPAGQPSVRVIRWPAGLYNFGGVRERHSFGM